MANFKEFCRLGELLNEADPYYNKDLMRMLQRTRGSGTSPIVGFLDRVGRNMGGSGLGSLPVAVWDSIKKNLASLRQPEAGQGQDYPPIRIGNLCVSQQGCATDLEAAFAIIKKSNYGRAIDKGSLLPIMIAYNKMIRRTVQSHTIDFWAYYNGLRNFYSNPETMLSGPRSDPGPDRAREEEKIEVLPSPTKSEIEIVKDAARAIEQSVKGTSQEKIVMDAVAIALRDLTDEQMQDIASRDKRFRRSREEIKSGTGFSWKDFKSSMERDDELRSRYERVSRMMRKQRRSAPEPQARESWPKPPLMDYSEFD